MTLHPVPVGSHTLVITGQSGQGVGQFNWFVTGGGSSDITATPSNPESTESAAVESPEDVQPPPDNSVFVEDAPFRDCLAYATKLKGVNPDLNDGKKDVKIDNALLNLPVFHFPSSATYTIEGRASLVKLAKNIGGKGEFTIQIFKDLKNKEDNKIGLENGAPNL